MERLGSNLVDANRAFGHLRPPTAEQIKKYAARYHMTLSDEHAADFVSVMSAIMMDIDKIDELPEPPAPQTFQARDPGRPPTAEEDTYNAFIRFCTVRPRGG